MKRQFFGVVVVCALMGRVPGAVGDILYQDVSYWMPDGSSIINPTDPPLDALVKVQETVFDDAQGKGVLAQQMGAGAIHGPALPTYALNLYCYSITNLTYGNGASGDGAGVTGFHVPNVANLTVDRWAPNAANSWWDVAPGHATGNFDWDIDGDADGDDGDGLGVLLGQSFDSFCVAVLDGTPHGFVDRASVHTWSGGGLLEESNDARAIDAIYGVVSAPVPEPSSWSLLVGACLIGLRKRGK